MCCSTADLRASCILLCALLGALALGVAHAQTPPPAPSGDDAIPAVAIADDGTGVTRVVQATRFSIEAPYANGWSAERPEVRSGLLVVLEVRKDLVRPRQTRQPVLFAGDRPAEVLNIGFESGKIVAIIADRPGAPADLARLELFFGTAMLAEQVTAERGDAERAAARAKGIAPLPAEARAATAEQALALAGRAALLRAAGERILVHAPDEKERAEAFIAGSP